MRLDLTKQTFVTNFLYVVLLVIVVCGGWLGVPDLVVKHQTLGLPLGNAIDNLFIDFPIATIGVTSFLMLLNVFLVTRLCVKNVAFLDQSYMPAFIYVVVCSGYLNEFSNIRPLIALAIILYAFGQVFKSYNIKSLTAGLYLNIGFYFGLAATIYEPAIFLLPLVFIALMIFRFFEIREWIAAIVGFSLPLFFAGYVNWLVDSDFIGFYYRYIEILMTPTGEDISWQSVTITQWVFFGIISLLILLSIIKMLTRRTFYHVNATKAYLFFVWFMLLSLIMFIYSPCQSLNMLPIVAAPISVIVPAFFHDNKSTFWTNLLFAILIGSVIVLHIIPMVINVL